jgi:hypothetical protein
MTPNTDETSFILNGYSGNSDSIIAKFSREESETNISELRIPTKFSTIRCRYEHTVLGVHHGETE